MIHLVAFLTYLFKNPRVLLALGLIVVLTASVFYAKRLTHTLLENIRNDVREEYLVRDLKQSVKTAEADRLFAQSQAAKAEASAEELRSDLSHMASAVKASSVTIHERVASGELPSTTISPVVSATLDQIDALEAARSVKGKPGGSQ